MGDELEVIKKIPRQNLPCHCVEVIVRNLRAISHYLDHKTLAGQTHITTTRLFTQTSQFCGSEMKHKSTYITLESVKDLSAQHICKIDALGSQLPDMIHWRTFG